MIASIVVNTGMTWEAVIDLPPARIGYIKRMIDEKKVLDKADMFDANAALVDKNYLKKLNDELFKLRK